ncbi:hypothetical protein QYM36_011268 [Artemia franciscana]|uniref:Reverse transcriptase domain-containing protein n=1 Tax=Artemia franciscana TaxID=6661 RepID=A0AA88HUU4_ARTSF|nr:hypothetical protein QYM36_011268 [Artemia franciscana]
MILSSKKISSSILHLVKGYWQIELEKGSRENTAFQKYSRLYQFLVIPFSLHGTPTTFQRLMDKVLEPFKIFTLAYLDKILIFSEVCKKPLCMLKEPLESIQKAGFRVHPRKIKLAQNEVFCQDSRFGNGEIAPIGK